VGCVYPEARCKSSSVCLFTLIVDRDGKLEMNTGI
jgi:hypothetical protein